jgi:hypothetical protein
MGGSGSGSWYKWSTKSTVENHLEISIFYMVKRGWIKEGIINSGNLNWSRRSEEIASIGYSVNTCEIPPTISLRYTNTNGRTGKKTEMNYPVYLTTTTPHYGGVRWWFLCPANGCGRRVAKLYGGKIFACRPCHNLAYASQNQTPPFRMART